MVFLSRYARAWRGRRTWRQWQCPVCHQPFGSEARLKEWRRRKGAGIKSALFAGAVVHCSRCTQDFWFTWSGHHLQMAMEHSPFEIVESASWSDL